MPGLRRPSPFGTVTSTWKTRVELSAEAAIEVILPSKRRPGSELVVIAIGLPCFTSPSTTAGTPKTALTELRSAMTKPTAPGAASPPTSMFRCRITPFKGEVSLQYCRSSSAPLSCAFAPATADCAVWYSLV